MNLQNTTGGRLSSADETRGEEGRNKLPGARQSGRGPGAHVAYVFVSLGITVICQ